LLRGPDLRRLAQLKRGFKVFFDHAPQQYNPALFDLACSRALTSWAANRSKRDMQRSMADSPPDWSDRFTRLFLKSQTVKKLGAAGGPAKAGQLIATFPKSRIFEDAVWAEYVGAVIEKWRRPTTYLHNQPLSAMSAWYRKHWRPGPSTASDYTSWDSGCDMVFAHFDAWILTSSGVPLEYVTGYLDRKLETRSYLGPLMPMQFSGDRWTWLFNTTRNSALSGATYDLSLGHPGAFSGDDMIVPGTPNMRADFRPRDWPMTPKVVVSAPNDFCGFEFGGSDIYVSAAALLHRAQVGLADGRNDVSFWDSFDLALRHGGKLSDQSYLAAAAALSGTARDLYNLPPSRFPFSFEPA
jgi:hypothetical protein